MSEQLVHLDPTKVQAGTNTRWGLKPEKVLSLSESIMETGGVLEPILVEVLSPPVNGFTHGLIAGAYRLAAVLKLNAEQGAGLSIPAVIRQPADATARLREQLAENVDRENLSPMDSAIAIKALMDAGVSRKEIREVFARPTGKKGTQVQPASNAWVNIVLAFLELPKTIQEKIHTGVIGVEAAYELGKVTPDKRLAVVQRAEAEYNRQQEIEAKDEEKYLASVSKLEKAQATEVEAVGKVDGAKAAVESAKELLKARNAELEVIRKEPYMTYDEKGKTEMKDRLKAAETNVKGAQKAVKDAENEVATLLKTASKAAETVKEQRARLEAARKAKPANKKPITKKDVQVAAAAEGENTGAQPLDSGEKTEAIKELTKMERWPLVQAIGKAVLECFKGITTPKELGEQLALITGERKAGPAKRTT